MYYIWFYFIYEVKMCRSHRCLQMSHLMISSVVRFVVETVVSLIMTKVTVTSIFILYMLIIPVLSHISFPGKRKITSNLHLIYKIFLFIQNIKNESPHGISLDWQSRLGIQIHMKSVVSIHNGGRNRDSRSLR